MAEFPTQADPTQNVRQGGREAIAKSKEMVRDAAVAGGLAAAGAVLRPLGRGSTASLRNGTTLARNLREQLAIEQAIANPLGGRQIRSIIMNDSRWLASDGWVKMEQVIQSGGREGPTIVHYVYNTITGAIDDFKIVLSGSR